MAAVCGHCDGPMIESAVESLGTYCPKGCGDHAPGSNGNGSGSDVAPPSPSVKARVSPRSGDA